MKRVFISQPMSDRTDAEITAERYRATKRCKRMFGEDVEIIDTFFQAAPHDAKPLWFLGKSLELLSDADVAYFCKGWESHRGCKLEYEAAFAYGIPVIVDGD